MSKLRALMLPVAAFCGLGLAACLFAQESLRAFPLAPATPPSGQRASRNDAIGDPANDDSEKRLNPRMDVLKKAEWNRIDTSIERALRYLASQQQSDGSIESVPQGQPAVTSLAVMAFLSAGHQPGEGPYGAALGRAIDSVLECQRGDGIFTFSDISGPIDGAWGGPSHAATYNHAITGLMLGEALGQTGSERAAKIRPAIERAIAYSRKLQQRRKRYPVDTGGLRHIRDVPISGTGGGDADLSVTAWHLMFMRSAKNAGFDVPVEYVNDMLQFVGKCYDPATGGFRYSLYTGGDYVTLAMTGAGVLSLFLAGRQNAEIEANAGRFMLQHSFRQFQPLNTHDRYYYSAYYCSQAALMIGGTHWERYYPDLTAAILERQGADGAWPTESDDANYGQCYSSALAVLTLTPPYQLLPIYQR